MSAVLAIDPGPIESAYVVWDGVKIIGYGKVPNEELRREGRHYAFKAIEMIASYGMPVGAEVFETCVWIGRFWEAWGGVNLVYRKTVTMHICGSVRAKDSNIRQALIDRLGPTHTHEKVIGPKGGVKKKLIPGVTYGITKDCWQALALAVTWWDSA